MASREGPTTGGSPRIQGRRHAAAPLPAASAQAPLPAKLRPPQPRVRLVQRDALLAALQRASSPLVLLTAPAGSGKSTVLLQWSDHDRRPFVWVQLDPADSDPVVFLDYLLQALEPVAGVDVAVRAALSLEAPPVRERVLPRLAEAVAAASPFVLVLDDAHVLDGDKTWEVIGFLLRSLPNGAQLAIGSRSDPRLPLSRLRATGDVAEFHAADLALRPSEVAAFMRLHDCEPDQAMIDTMLAATEGWVTGLRLACLSRGDRPPEEWLPEIRGTRREIAEFLTAEVLEAQPAEIQEFLLRTSVLHELTPRLCALVAGGDDAGELLSRVAHDGLFVVPVGVDGAHYRYHQLFAEMLEAELERRRPALPDDLHRTVAAWYGEHGQPDGAVRHLLAAGDVAAAGELVAAAWPAMWSRGQVETVRRWLGSFTDRQILAQPALTLTAGWIFSALDAGRLGERWCEAACAAIMDDVPSPDGAASLRSSQALLRATVGAEGVRRMREDAELAASLEARPGTSWYADARVALGVARWLSGQAQRAFHPLAVGAREGSICNPSAELAALGYLALMAVDEGEWEVAAEYEERAAGLLAASGFGTNRRCLPMLLARVRLLAHAADPDADAAVDDVMRLLGHMVPHPWMALLADVELGEGALARSDAAAAARHAESAAAALRRYPDAGILRRRTERLLEAVELIRLAEPLTPAERRVLDLLPTHLTEAQVAERLFVSRNTVKTHLKGVYRKLGVSSRSDAVGRARELGLLQPGD